MPEKFTAQKPTEPGWYWVRVMKRSPMDHPWTTVAEVFSANGDLFIFSKATGSGKRVSDTDKIYSGWIGPFQWPDPPEWEIPEWWDKPG